MVPQASILWIPVIIVIIIIIIVDIIGVYFCRFYFPVCCFFGTFYYYFFLLALVNIFTVDGLFGTVNKYHLARQCFASKPSFFFTNSHFFPLEDELVGSFSSHLVAAVGWLLARQRQKAENRRRVYGPK